MKFLFVLLLSINAFSNQIPVQCLYRVSEITDSLKCYSNANYRIIVDDNGTIDVEINYKPVKIKARYPFRFNNVQLLNLISENKKESGKLLFFAEQISEISSGYYDCVNEALNFISQHFVYSEKIKPPFQGDCNTAAETTVKILALCGIPARIRYAVRFENNRSAIISGKSLHAIVEIYYPGYGWAFSDPVKYHHFIPASYLLVNKTDKLLGLKFYKKNCLTEKAFIDILKGKTIIYKLPNLLRFIDGKKKRNF